MSHCALGRLCGNHDPCVPDPVGEAQPCMRLVKVAFLILTSCSGIGAPWLTQCPTAMLTALNLCVTVHTGPGQECPPP